MHAPDCDEHEWFVVLGKKQETNTGGEAIMPDHYRCTITCAFCGKRKHYEDISATTSSARQPSRRARPRAAVEVPEARAKARKARGGLKGDEKGKVKHEAKVEDAETPTGRTRTGTRTG